MTERLISILIGYVFGLFQTSYIIGKMHKTDIREHGSGNAGTTNALRTFGKKAGAITLLGDCLKCVLAIMVVRLIFAGRETEMMPLLCIYAAADVFSDIISQSLLDSEAERELQRLLDS